jgi:hypothetical protein
VNFTSRHAKVGFAQNAGRSEALLDVERFEDEVNGGAVHAPSSAASGARVTPSGAMGIFSSRTFREWNVL